MGTVLLTVLAILAAVYVAAVLALYVLEGRLVFPVDLLHVEPAQVGLPEMRIVTVRTRDGLDLIGWHQPPAIPDRPTVLLFHGNGESLSRRAHVLSDLIDAGYGVYQAEYRGYAGNPGKPCEAGLYEDGRAAIGFLEGQGASVVLHGYSLGSGVAVQLATECRIEALILEAPFTSITEVASRRFPFIPVKWLIRNRFENLAKINRVRAPVLIYHGTRDAVIPGDQFNRLFNEAREPKRIVRIEGADHVDAWESGGAEVCMDFLMTLQHHAS
jgi:fermentation-respiration switch protein FrsA (DUF1100 family)